MGLSKGDRITRARWLKYMCFTNEVEQHRKTEDRRQESSFRANMSLKKEGAARLFMVASVPLDAG